MKKIYLLFMFVVLAGFGYGQTLPENWTGDSGIDTYKETTTVHGGAAYYKKDVNSDSAIDFKTSLSAPVTNAINGTDNLIISEVADPANERYGRFVELYNLGSTDIDLAAGNWYLTIQVNGGTTYHDKALSGVIHAGETFVTSYSATHFNTDYGFNSDQNSGFNGNGDDGYYLYKGGDHSSSSSTLVDAYGVLDEDGTGKAWEYTDSKAVRKYSVTGPNTTWTASEWVITNPANVSDMTPEWHHKSLTWNGSSTTWNTAANWTDGGNTSSYAPDAGANVTIPDAATTTNSPVISSNAGASCNNLTINSNGILNIFPSNSLTVGGNLANNNGSAAGLVVQSSSSGNGSLIVDGTVSGNDVTVQRYIGAYTTGSDDGWHEIGSPVNNMAISGSAFAPGTSDDLYAWDEATYTWLNSKDGTNSISSFTNGKGYLVAYQTTATKSFTGTPNNSDISLSSLNHTATGNGWNLLGNPFPSAIKWNDGNWTLTNVGSVAEIWEEAHATYKAVNANDIIPSTNGFFVQVASGGSGSVTIPAAARIHDATNNFKSASATNPKETLTFKITDDANSYADESILGFRPDATKDWDIAYDAHKIMSMVNAAPQIWTVSDSQKFLVNCLPEMTTAYDVPLHFHSGVNTVYHLTIQGADSFQNTSLVLEDLQTDQKIDLSNASNYDFSAQKGDDPNRFVLHINGVTAVPNVNKTDGIQVFAYGHTVYLHAAGQKALQGKINVLNMLGQKVYEGTLNGSSSRQIKLSGLKSGIYFVRVEGESNAVTQKVFLK